MGDASGVGGQNWFFSLNSSAAASAMEFLYEKGQEKSSDHLHVLHFLLKCKNHFLFVLQYVDG